MSTPWRRTLAPAASTNRLPATWRAAEAVAVGGFGPEATAEEAAEDDPVAGARATGRAVAPGVAEPAVGSLAGGVGSVEPVPAIWPGGELDLGVAEPVVAGLHPAPMTAAMAARAAASFREIRSFITSANSTFR
jgi:hypothetical protein